jgi:hypothetical protein
MRDEAQLDLIYGADDSVGRVRGIRHTNHNTTPLARNNF